MSNEELKPELIPFDAAIKASGDVIFALDDAKSPDGSLVKAGHGFVEGLTRGDQKTYVDELERLIKRLQTARDAVAEL